MPRIHHAEPAPQGSPAAPRSGLENLPTLPIVVGRLIRLYSSDDYGVEEVVQALETDPAISSRVMRLANSAYYGFARQVELLSRGVVLLGGVTVQGIALGATVLRRWARNAPPEAVREIWVHAYLCGVGARRLGSRLPISAHLPPPDALFMIGLFHDLGKIVFLAEEPDRYAPLLEELAGAELREAERTQFGQDHAQVGGELLEIWGLPTRVASVVRHHHDGDLRAELQPALEVVRCIDDLLAEGVTDGAAARSAIPDALRGDLQVHLERARPGAEAFYEAIA